jgi:two-component system, OmpR family, phosphate regulon sensor histidine kinase PhoR
MWPVIVFIVLAAGVIADSLWKERRLRRQRRQAKEAYTAQLLAQQKQAYAHAQAQQRALFDSMVDGVLLLDKDDRIQLVNDSLRALFTLRAGGGPGQSLSEAFGLPGLNALVERLHREKSVLGFELEVASTPARSLEINANAVEDADGNYQGAIFVFHDLTRLKQLENTRKEFVGNVSHELRTPLSLIKGFVETLLDGAKEEPERATRYLKTIQKHTDRLTFLIEDLLTISQLEGGRVMLNRQEVFLRSVAERVIEDLRSKAVENQIEIQNNLPPDLRARADADRVEQVLFNLVENAIKYGGPHGTVQIRGCATSPDWLEVSVQDNGPGIPVESQTRVFERFYRVDRARSRETGGTGLGLSIVKHIVLAHGGHVGLASTPGQGATFSFTLPQFQDGAE